MCHQFPQTVTNPLRAALALGPAASGPLKCDTHPHCHTSKRADHLGKYGFVNTCTLKIPPSGGKKVLSTLAPASTLSLATRWRSDARNRTCPYSIILEHFNIHQPSNRLGRRDACGTPRGRFLRTSYYGLSDFLRKPWDGLRDASGPPFGTAKIAKKPR